MSYQAPPPPTVIRNVAPQGRANRVDKKVYREELEKSRLRARAESFVRYGDEINKPFEIAPDAVGFLSDANRFHSDTAGEEKRNREEKQRQKMVAIHTLRQANQQREEDRYRRAEEEDRRKAEEAAYLQNESKKKIRNQSSMPYDVITHKNHDGLDGLRLQAEDDRLQYQAQIRLNLLHSKQNLNGYNPITGELRPNLAAPPRPETPQALREAKSATQRPLH